MIRQSHGISQQLAATILVLAVAVAATTARAQQVVVIVNGEPITALDIEQRTKLTQFRRTRLPRARTCSTS